MARFSTLIISFSDFYAADFLSRSGAALIENRCRAIQIDALLAQRGSWYPTYCMSVIGNY